jgi:hypothetical protein
MPGIDMASRNTEAPSSDPAGTLRASYSRSAANESTFAEKQQDCRERRDARALESPW